MAENKEVVAEEKKPSGWENFSVPAECISEKHVKVDTANITISPETGEEVAARSAWHVVTLPKGFEIGGEDVGGYTFSVPAPLDKELPADFYNEGWTRVGLREDSTVKLRSRDEDGKISGIREVSAPEFAQAAQTGFGPKPSDPVFINFSKRSVSGPTVNKETGQEVYTATIAPNTVVNGLDIGGYKVNFPKQVNEKTGKSNVFEHQKSIAFMVRGNQPIDLLKVNNETGAVDRLPMPVTAGAVKDACDKSYENYKARQTEKKQEDLDKKASKDAPAPKRVSSQKKAAPVTDAPAKTQAKS